MEYLYGRNAVLESLRARRRNHNSLRILLSARHDERIAEILERAAEHSIDVVEVPRDDLDRLAPAGNQGVILETSSYPYSRRELKPGADSIYLALDELEDPRNVGSLIRTAESAGVDGIVFPERRSVDVTPAVVNASSGAAEHLHVWREKNLARWLSSASEKGCWIVGLDGGEGSENLFDADLPLPAVLVVGSEGRGSTTADTGTLRLPRADTDVRSYSITECGLGGLDCALPSSRIRWLVGST